MKILAIDDHADNLTALAAVLRELLPAAEVLTAREGLAGIELVRRHDPDVILLDIVMPGLDGYAVCRQLKADEALRDIPVVFLTALRTDRAGRIQALQAGAEGFLSKPPDEQELFAMVTAMAKVKAAARLRRLESRELATRVSERTAALRRELDERARIEDALQAERDKLRGFLAAAPVALFVFDAREEVVLANPAAERLFGPGGELGGLRCGDHLRCAHRQDSPVGCGQGPRCPACGVYAAVRRALAGWAEHDREAEVVLDRDGTCVTRSLVVHAEPMRSGNGPGAVLALHDVTELRRVQREREALQAKLAQSDRLVSMGLLAAGVAHEINNPLSYVLFNLEGLAEELPLIFAHLRRCQESVLRLVGSDAAPAILGETAAALDPTRLADLRDRLQEAAAGAQRIRQITRGLGTFARVERSERVPVNVLTSIAHAVAMARNEIRFRARLVEELRPVPEVIGSEGKLAQVVLNLLVNAAHAIEEGHTEANEIRIRSFTEGDEVVIEVSDTGTGIAPEHQPRLFEPFFTTKGIGVGSGLGLSICQRIVTELGGRIAFETEVGRGTTFRIGLPRKPADWAPEATPPAAPAGPTPSPRGRVLVIDDEPGVRRILSRLLGPEHEVVALASGEEAKERLAGDRDFDVILCDLMMPRISGMELHAWIAERWPEVARSVVFVTGGAFTPGAGDYLARVENPRLDKPFEPEAVKRLVAERARARRGGAS